MDHHRRPLGHAFTCAWDDDVRARREARREGLSPVFSSPAWAGPERVDGCMGTGCLRGRHRPLWYRDHVYEPPPAVVLLDRMRWRRVRRAVHRSTAAGVVETRTIFVAYCDPDHVFEDAWDVAGDYGDLWTAVHLTRRCLDISKFVAPVPDGRGRWTLYSAEHDVTAIIERRVVTTLVRP